jgi:hypothetical protein
MQNGSGPAAISNHRPSHFDNLKKAAEEHIGSDPALDRIIDGLLELATRQANGDQASILLCGLAGDSSSGNVMNLLGYVIAHLGHPASNSALMSDVPASRLRDIQHHTTEFARYLEMYLPVEHVDEAVWALSPGDLL